jgi:hypothetical protein
LSNSAFHLVQTGTDLADAKPTVAQLLGVNGADKVIVELEIETDSQAVPKYFDLTSIADVQMEYCVPPAHAERVEALLVPDGRTREGVPGPDGVDLWVLPTDLEALKYLSELPPTPVTVHLLKIAADDFDWDVVRRIDGSERAVVRWTDCWWRPVPEAGLEGDSKHAGVVLSVNSANVWAFTPAPGTYQLSIETREGAEGDRRARWIAEQIGRRVLPE